MTTNRTRQPRTLRATWKTGGHLFVTIALYTACLFGLLDLGKDVSLSAPPVGVAWIFAAGLAIVVSLAINLVLRPFRYKIQLLAYDRSVSHFQAMADRLFMLLSKSTVPFFLGEPASYAVIARRLKIGREDTARLWMQDKVITLAGLAPFLLVFVAFQALTRNASALLVAYLSGIIVMLAFAGWSYRFPDAASASSSQPRGLDVVRIGKTLRARLPNPAGRRKLVLLGIAEESLQALALGVMIWPLVSASILGATPDVEPSLTLATFITLVLLSHVASSLPLGLAGGAGTREAAVLIFFSPYGSSEGLFFSALLATLLLRALPALLGVAFLSRAVMGSREHVKETATMRGKSVAKPGLFTEHGEEVP